nr:ATP-binding cassette domain-containing protein [uncultured Rhodopila sp.]
MIQLPAPTSVRCFGADGYGPAPLISRAAPLLRYEQQDIAPGSGTVDIGAVTLDRVTLKRNGRAILSNLTLAFPRGTITALVGCSGVGKSTLMGALNGLIAPAAGSICIAGAGRLDDAKSLREARRGTATIFQDHALIDRLPAIDNVLLGLADMRHPLSPLPWPKSFRIRAAIALDEVGLLARATARAGQLSGGERQRVGIARALVRRPRLLLGDEPFASVDPVLARQLGEAFRSLVVRNGLTVILVLHQIPLARTLADRIVGLADARVAFDGPAADFDSAAEDAVFSAAPARKRSTPCSAD